MSAEETLDLYAFMESADESRRRGFVPVQVADVRKQAAAAADQKVRSILASE